jgi:hypothetical protein
MFWNHEDLDTILKRGHGSRDPRDLCGWLQEGTWWDPNYTEPDDKNERAAQGRRHGPRRRQLDGADELLDLPEGAGCRSTWTARRSRRPHGRRASSRRSSRASSRARAASTSSPARRAPAARCWSVYASPRACATVPAMKTSQTCRPTACSRRPGAPRVAEHFREADPDRTPEDQRERDRSRQARRGRSATRPCRPLVEALAGRPLRPRRRGEGRRSARTTSAPTPRAEGAARSTCATCATRRTGSSRPARSRAGRHPDPHLRRGPRGAATRCATGHPTPALDVYDELDDDGDRRQVRPRAPARGGGGRHQARGGQAPRGRADARPRPRRAPDPLPSSTTNETDAEREAREAREREADKDPLADELGLDTATASAPTSTRGVEVPPSSKTQHSHRDHSPGVPRHGERRRARRHPRVATTASAGLAVKQVRRRA